MPAAADAVGEELHSPSLGDGGGVGMGVIDVVTLDSASASLRVRELQNQCVALQQTQLARVVSLQCLNATGSTGAGETTASSVATALAIVPPKLAVSPPSRSAEINVEVEAETEAEAEAEAKSVMGVIAATAFESSSTLSTLEAVVPSPSPSHPHSPATDSFSGGGDAGIDFALALSHAGCC